MRVEYMEKKKKARMRRAQRMALRNGRQDRVFTVTYEEGGEKDGRKQGFEPQIPQYG